jgi:hypothetical protein
MTLHYQISSISSLQSRLDACFSQLLAVEHIIYLVPVRWNTVKFMIEKELLLTWSLGSWKIAWRIDR